MNHGVLQCEKPVLIWHCFYVQVELEATVRPKGYVIIDELRIAVGSAIFDKMEEVTCQ